MLTAVQVSDAGNAGVNLTGNHPLPGLTPGPLIFPSKSPPPGQLSVQNSGPRVEKTKQIPTPGHNLPCLNAKRSMRKEHSKAVCFQTFHNCPFDNFLFSENKVFVSLYTTLKINTV